MRGCLRSCAACGLVVLIVGVLLVALVVHGVTGILFH